MRAQFVSTCISNEYDAPKPTVLNRADGPVDSVVLKLKDLLGIIYGIPSDKRSPRRRFHDTGDLFFTALHRLSL